MSSISKIDAEVRALALKKKMKGKGWKTRVWENMGWFFEVKNGPITVIGDEGNYFAMVGLDGSGNGCWTCGGYPDKFADPNRAVAVAVKHARKQLDECIKIVKTSEKIVGNPKRK